MSTTVPVITADAEPPEVVDLTQEFRNDAHREDYVAGLQVELDAAKKSADQGWLEDDIAKQRIAERNQKDIVAELARLGVEAHCAVTGEGIDSIAEPEEPKKRPARGSSRRSTKPTAKQPASPADDGKTEDDKGDGGDA